MSKALATVATQPLIVAKVGLQSRPPPSRNGKPFKTFGEVMKHIVDNEGLLALFKGIGPQILKGLLVQGLLMMTKERYVQFRRNVQLSANFTKDGTSLHCLVCLPEGHQEAEVGQDCGHSCIKGPNQSACYSQIIVFWYIGFPFRFNLVCHLARWYPVGNVGFKQSRHFRTYFL